MRLEDEMRIVGSHAQGKLLAGAIDRIGVVLFNQPEKRNAVSLEMSLFQRGMRSPRSFSKSARRCSGGLVPVSDDLVRARFFGAWRFQSPFGLLPAPSL